MSRFYFDVTDRDILHRDEEGMECADGRAVRRETLDALSEMSRATFRRDGERHDLHIDVRNGNGRIVFTACVGLTARWLNEAVPFG